MSKSTFEQYFNCSSIREQKTKTILERVFVNNERILDLSIEFNYSRQNIYERIASFNQTILRSHEFNRINKYSEEDVRKIFSNNKKIGDVTEEILVLYIAYGWDNLRIAEKLKKDHLHTGEIIRTHIHKFPQYTAPAQIQIVVPSFKRKKATILKTNQKRSNVDNIVESIYETYTESENNDKSIQDIKASSEKNRIISMRTVQADYRKKVLALWNNKCGVTSCNIKELLIAGHIKPFAVYVIERSDPNNGIPLIPNLATLFDKYLISFNSSGHLCMATQLNDYKKILGLSDELKLTTELNDTQKKYMDLHYKRFLNIELYKSFILGQKSSTYLLEVNNSFSKTMNSLIDILNSVAIKKRHLKLLMKEVALHLLIATPKNFWQSYFRILQVSEKFAKNLIPSIQTWLHEQYVIYKSELNDYSLLILYLDSSMKKDFKPFIPLWIKLNKSLTPDEIHKINSILDTM